MTNIDPGKTYNWTSPECTRRDGIERRKYPTVYHTYGMRSNWDRRLSDKENEIAAALIESSDEYYGKASHE